MIELKSRWTAFALFILLLGVWVPARAWAQGTGEFLCNGGTRQGLACESDDDCVPDGVCVVAQGVCNGGTDDGQPCECLGGTCSATPVCSGDASLGTCSAGLFAGQCCDQTFNCAGNRPCAGTAKVCLGGDAKGFPCVANSQCPSSTCGYTSKFCAGLCGGVNTGALCLDDTDCPGTSCTSDFQSDACVDDTDCCTSEHQPCKTGICRGPVVSSTATNTPTRGTRTPTRTRTPSPTGGLTPGTPTATPSGGVTVTPTPSATRTTSTGPGANLVSAISASSSSISVDDASDFPDSGTLIIDSEQIAYTAKFGNTFVNVQRGVNGTTAAAHGTGTLVRLLSSTLPPTQPPRDVIYRVIGEGSGCALNPGPGTSVAQLVLAGVAMWALRRRRPH